MKYAEKLQALLRLFMKNSRLSDREMARTLHISQPTVSRLRASLEKDGYIRSYTIVPEFSKVGYKIMAFTFSKMKSYPTAKEAEEVILKGKKWAAGYPNIIYVADGQGLGGKDFVLISVHKDYDDYTRFIHAFAYEWSQILSTFETFITNTVSDLNLKPFDLAYLAKDKTSTP